MQHIVKRYDVSSPLALSSRFSDTDMINYCDESGRRVPVPENVLSLEARDAHRAESIGPRYFIPFSSMRVYPRKDSIWANRYQTSLEDYADGFRSNRRAILPAFVRYDCERDGVEEIRPAKLPITMLVAAG